GPAGLGKTDPRGGPEHEQFAQRLVALPADASGSVSPAGRVLLRGDTEPSGEMAAGAEARGIADFEREAHCADRPDAGLAGQALADRVGFVPRHQLGLERLDIEVE